MKKNPQNKDENTNKKISEDSQEKEVKKGFFKKVWYSIDKIEKYAELSAEGFGKAIKYLSILVIILSVVSSLVSVYKTSLEMKNIAQYINENAPELTYKEGTLQVESEEVITEENSNFGKVIIDTKTDSEEQINQYINEINEENGIIILKNKLILKEVGIQGTANYDYKELFAEIGITEFNKQQIVDYLTSSDMMPIYLNLFLVLFIYAFVINFINTLCYIVMVALVGYVATLILKLKIRFVAVFNMSIYAVTLPTILNIVYLIINAFLNYTINYFDIMYMLVASIYVIAAVFMLKLDFNKKQGEVQKIVEVQKEVKEEMEEKERQEEENKKKNKEKNKDTGKKDKKKKEQTNEGNTNGEEPEGSNA